MATGNSVRLVWDVPLTVIEESLADSEEGMVERLVKAMMPVAEEVQEFMVRMHPWTNRTGEAEEKLRAKVFDDGQNVGLFAWQGAPHGIWLEIRWGGKWGVIPMALSWHQSRVMTAISSAIWARW